MRRESHVRFWEGPGVRFPRATRLVIGFKREEDARQVMAMLPERLSQFGLTVHPTKTRLIDFRKPAPKPCSKDGDGEGPGTFDFLGFGHYWGKTRHKRIAIFRKTAKSRFARAVSTIASWCREHRHDPIASQVKALKRKLNGHYAYYGITGNSMALEKFKLEVERTWLSWLRRRSERRRLLWDKFREFLASQLPKPRIVHSAMKK